ncbi:MAG TPA: ATP-binding protein [Rariglobus sp.]
MNTAALSASELRYRRLFEAARDGILIVDPETRKIVDVNPFLVEFLGYSHAEFVGRELFEFGLLKDEAASQAAFGELQRAGFIRYEDLPLETKAGLRVDVEFVSNLYQEGEKGVIQCNVRDITVRKRTETALHEADLKLALHAADLEEVVNVRTAELRLSNTQLEAFVYSIAHDLRAPLRTMQGFSQLLVQDHSAELTQESRDYANFINRAAQSMDRLLADLLAFSHISQRAMVLEAVPLGPVVRDALADCESEIRKSRARVEVIGDWPVVFAHAVTLRQAVVNLITNAVKFVADKVPHVRVRAEKRPGGAVRLWVEDNGIGIPPEFHARIFNVFQRLHTKAYEGTGIGLAIVQKGVERMGGSAGVVSAAGEGSRFWIELSTPAGDLPEPDKPNAV